MWLLERDNMEPTSTTSELGMNEIIVIKRVPMEETDIIFSKEGLRFDLGMKKREDFDPRSTFYSMIYSPRLECDRNDPKDFYALLRYDYFPGMLGFRHFPLRNPSITEVGEEKTFEEGISLSSVRLHQQVLARALRLQISNMDPENGEGLIELRDETGMKYDFLNHRSPHINYVLERLYEEYVRKYSKSF